MQQPRHAEASQSFCFKILFFKETNFKRNFIVMKTGGKWW